MNVTIYNTDAVNPYATEIAALLAAGGGDVELLDAANGAHRPPAGVRWRRVLPASFGGAPAWHQALRLARGLATATRASGHGRVLLVTFTRFSVEPLLFALLARLGRPVVLVLHNPVARQQESAVSAVAHRALRRAARTVVVHSERLRAAVDPVVRDRVTVCPHPPYAFTTDTAAATPAAVSAPLAAATPPPRRWLAFIGALRWDKGIEVLPDILERVPAAERGRLGLIVCGRGSLPAATWARLRELGYEVEDLTSPEPVPQAQLLGVLARHPTVLAPYVAATQSGTAILALSTGCRVLAFDAGAIPDIVAADGLVANGDLDAMAAAIAADRAGTGVLDDATWLAQAGAAWCRAVTDAHEAPRVRPDDRIEVTRRGLRRFPRARVRLDRTTDAGRHTDLHQAVDAILADPPDRVSIDIFDTVLTRRVLRMEHVWHLVATGLGRTGEPDHTTNGTAGGFVAFRRQLGRTDPTTSLRTSAANAEVTAAWGDGLEAAEIRAERAVLRPVPGAVRALARLRDAGLPLTFLSDMHLSADELKRMLAEHDLATGDDRVVVSCEHGVSKADGGLFALLDTDQSRTVHLGNDLWGDVAMAGAAQLRTIAVRNAEPTREELVMGRNDTGVGGAVAAAGRLARLDTRADDTDDDRALRELGSAYGQCMTAFLLWVRTQCEQEGIDRLVFLARDGEIALRMARALPADHLAGLDLRYLQLAARRAWLVPAAVPLGVEAWMRVGLANDRAFLNTSRHLVALTSLLQRVAHTPDELDGHPGLQTLDPTRPLPVDRGEAWEAFLADDRVRTRMLERAHVQLDALVGYLEPRLPTDGRLALVDVGWRGQLAWMMSAVLRDVTGHEPLHLHVGGSNVAAELDADVDIRRFAFDDRDGPLPFADVVPSVETFTTSGASRIVGIARTDGDAQADGDAPPGGDTKAGGDAPAGGAAHAGGDAQAGGDAEADDDGDYVLDVQPAITAIASTERARLWAAAVDVAAAMPSRAELDAWGLDDTSLAAETRDLLTGLWTDPSPVHARAAGRLVLEVDDVGELYGPVAHPYAWSEFTRSSGPVGRQWREGSLALTPPVRRWFIRLALAGRDVVTAVRSRR